MIVGVGGANPAALQSVQHQHKALATSATRTVVARAGAQKDCLATDSKAAAAVVHRSHSRSVNATPSMMRGAPMAGRDRAEKRYIGKGFQPPPAESPGPIYRPPPGFVEESTMAGSGFTFGGASRSHGSATASPALSTPGPNSYATPGCIGRQSVSTSKSAASAPFPKAARTNEKIFLSNAHAKNMHATDTPGPAAYYDDITRLPKTGPRAPSALLLSSKESDRKAFISRAHVVDTVGAAAKDADFASAAAVAAATNARFATPPAFGFGTAKRDVGEADVEPDIVIPEGADEKTATKIKRQALARQAMRASKATTPGPGEYGEASPKALHASAPKAVFPTAGKTDKVFWSKELSTRRGGDAPGMRYTPTYSATDRHTPAATIAQRRGAEPGKTYDRFTSKQFIGKAFASGKGEASPGPVYDAPAAAAGGTGPAYTIAGKEQHFDRKVFPGPTRPRWVSRESAKDNLGAFGPGPKYDTRGDFSKEGVAYSFGTGSRDRGGATPGPSAGTGGGSDKARRVDSAGSAAALETSPRRHIPGPRLVPPTNKRAVSPADKRNAERQAAALPLEPHPEATEPRAPAVAFTKAPRFGTKGPGTQGATGPGPVYTMNYRLTEPRVPGGSFGGLP